MDKRLKAKNFLHMSTFKKLSRALRAPYQRYFARRRLRAFHARARSLEETIDWAMNFGGGGYYRVKTTQIPVEILALAKTVRALQPKIILEIGTACGGTLLIWSQLAQQQAIGCDLRDMRHQALLFQDFPPPGSSCRVSLLSGNSHDPAFKERVRDTLNGRPVDFLFIDGDHTEAGVSKDYDDYREFVRPGGLIAFHDIVEHQPYPTNQVYPFWRRLAQQAGTEEIVNDPRQCGFGIGLVHVPPI